MLITEQQQFFEFVQRSFYLFVPSILFLAVAWFFPLNHEIWQTASLMASAIIFGLALVLSFENLIYLSPFWFDKNTKNELDTWVSEHPKAHVQPVDIRGNLEIVNLSFAYHDMSVLVIKDCHLTIKAKELHLIVGASGVGKSTLLKLASGMLRSQRGEVIFDGQDLRSLDLRALRKNFGVIFEDAQLFLRKT
jgi:ABC-type multidrug transport system fused ATPase/permease subunit